MVSVFLTIYFGHKDAQYGQAFFFVSFMLPVAIGSSYFINSFLVPKYLLTERYFKFTLFSIYTLIVGVYLLLLIGLFSFVVLANYQFDGMNALTVDVYTLASALFMIVLAQSFISLFRQVNAQNKQIEVFEQKKEANGGDTVVFTVNRKKMRVQTGDIHYIESLSDYVKVKTREGSFITRERISKLTESLPDHFIRVHRSFLVNRVHINTFSKEQVEVSGTRIPISRSYKAAVAALLAE
jgi:hypothetical protein